MLHLETNEKFKPSQRNWDGRNNAQNSKSFASRLEPVVSSDLRSTQTVEQVQTHFSQNEGTTILPTALIDIEIAGELFTVRALLDAGSEKSFLLKRIQQNLSIPVDNHNSQISGLGGTIVGNSTATCFINLKSRYSSFKIKIKAIVISKLAHFLPSKRVKIEQLPDLRNLQLADPNFFKPSGIDMIIGSDYLPFINQPGVRANIGKGLEARESHFGWYLSGPVSANDVNVFSTMVTNCNDLSLQEQLKKFWELEEVENVVAVSEDESYCEDYYRKTTFRQPDGRYVVRLPFKLEFPADVYLGHSRNMALAQYHRMENTLRKNINFSSEYHSVLKEYFDMGHMEVSTHFETSNDKQFSFFLPHHAVIRPESKTTKVRVVFNGSKKTSSGFSLNDVLYPGPILQKDLMQIVLNWR